MAFLPILGAIVGVAGSVVGAMNSAEMSSYQAEVARANAQIAERNRVSALQKGQIDTQVAGMKVAQQKGKIAAIQGASGMDMSGGTATEVRAGAETMGQLSEENENDKAKATAYNYEVQKAQYNNQASLYDMKASSDMTTGFFNAFSSVIGGASGFADKWSQFKTAGVNPWTGGLI